MGFFIAILLSSLIYTGIVAESNRRHVGKKIDKAIKRLKQHERHQDYIRKKRRLKRGKESKSLL